MGKTGSLDLPLHYGKTPRWLFEKMCLLARSICEIIIREMGRGYFLQRLSDPFWFQSLGCVLGFDWHSSGLTTTLCGALKEAFYDLKGYGVYVCGGKGATSRKTPQEITQIGEKLGKDVAGLIYTSKMVAKVDNNALQDGFTLYHHTFIFTEEEEWVVVQQGMAEKNGRWARRYHWFSQGLTSFVDDPHQAVVGERRFLTLNMVDKEKKRLRKLVSEISQRKPEENLREFMKLKENVEKLPFRHRILISDINPRYLSKIFLKTYEKKADDFSCLLSSEGVGAKTIRALALICDLIYGESISFRDPARFSFAHGGKDGYPYPINSREYQKTIEILNKVINKAKIERSDKIKALRRLYRFYQGRG